MARYPIEGTSWGSGNEGKEPYRFLQNLSDYPNQQLIRELLMPGVRVLIKWPLALGRNTVSPDENNPFKLHVHIYTYIYE